MKRLFLSAALMGAVASPLPAQTLQRQQSGYDVGPIISCIGLDGTSAARCLLPAMTLTDQTGAAIGTSGNPLYTTSSGGGGSIPTGSAGSPNASVITVQGITNGTPEQVQGAVASGTTDSGNPEKIGGKANSLTPSSVAAGARVDAWYSPAGGAVVTFGPTNAPTNNITGSVVFPVTTNGYFAPFAVQNYVWNGTTPITALGDANGSWVTTRGGSNLATGQVSVGTTATLIAAARTARQKITVTVTSAVQCSFGNAGVTLTTGFPLQAVAGANTPIDTNAALYGVCASTATVGYLEQY